MKKLSLFMMALATIAMIGCKKEAKVTAVQLNKTSIELAIGESEYLKATTTPTGAEVSWLSSDTKVATVNAGKVTAIESGVAVITATAGEITATCKVTVTASKAYSEFSVSEYGLFGNWDIIDGTDTILALTFDQFKGKDNPKGDTLVKCVVAYITAYAWGDDVMQNDDGFFGDGLVCCMENTSFYLINQDLMVDGKNYKGFYLGAGGITAVNTGDGKYYNGNCQAGQLDPATYGEFVQAQHDKDLTADFEKMQKKTYGAFVTRPSAQNNGELDSWYGLYNGHIDRLLIFDETEDADMRYAAEITFGNLDESQYLYGFEYDKNEWETNKKIVLLTPYAEHYNTVHMIYDPDGIFTNDAKEVVRYTVGDMSRVHKKMPVVNGTTTDKYKMARK